MSIEFAKVAPYLKDPLVLIGFFLFVAFLFARGLLTRGIIPPLQKKHGYRVLQTILLYGFLIGLLLIGLGFGLKRRELSETEERAAVSMLREEMSGNLGTAQELLKNCEVLVNVTTTVAGQLRDRRIPILPLLFPRENLENDSKAVTGPDAARLAMKRLEESGLLRNRTEMLRFDAAAKALAGTITRTLPTIRSLADSRRERYPLSTRVWQSELPILRKVRVVEVSRIQKINAELERVRANYDVVTARCIDYLEAVRRLLTPKDEELTASALAEALAVERLSMTMLSDYLNQLAASMKNVEKEVSALKAAER